MQRSTALIATARFISRTGGEAAFFVGIWGKAAYQFDADAGHIAALMAVLGLAGLVGSAIAGPLIDRVGPKRVLVISEVLFVPATLGAVFAGSMPALTAVAAAIGLFGAPTYTAIASFPPFLTTDEERLARMNAAVETAGMAALISGAALGGLMAATVGIDAIFWFDAATSLVAALMVWRITLSGAAPRHDAVAGWAGIRQGFATVYHSVRLRFYVGVTTALWSTFGLFSALEPLFYRDVVKTGPETLGAVNSLFGVGLVAGTLAAGRLPPRWRSARSVLVFLALNGLGSLIYVGTARLPVIFTGAVVWGALIGVLAPLVRTMLQVNSPDGQVGRVMGVTQVHSEAAKLAPLLIAPWLALTAGVQPSLIGSGLAVTVMAALLFSTGLRLDRTRTFAVPPVAGPRTADEPISPNP